MFFLILTLVIGSILAYISRNNFTPVSVNFGPYVINGVPLFYVMIGSLIAGLVVSYLVYLVRAVSMFFKIKGKDKEIKKDKNEVLELTKRVHQLELENERLKHKSKTEPEDKNAL